MWTASFPFAGDFFLPFHVSKLDREVQQVQIIIHLQRTAAGSRFHKSIGSPLYINSSSEKRVNLSINTFSTHSHLSGNDNHYHVVNSHYKGFPPRLQATFLDFA